MLTHSKKSTSRMYTVKVPLNGVSPKGQEEISKFLFNGGVSIRDSVGVLPKNWDWSWKAAQGEYAGTLPKRISRFLYQQHQIKLTKSEISEIGNIASKYIFRRSIFYVDFTNRFSWSAGDFGDEGSCFFGNGFRRHALDMIQENGGQAMRFYRGSKKRDGGFGRVWLVPTPSKNKNSPPNKNSKTLFNAYGIGLLPATRIYATLVDLSYQQVSITNLHNADGTLWINGGGGFVVGASSQIDTLHKNENIELDFRTWAECHYCNEGHPLVQLKQIPRWGNACPHCIENKFNKCSQCHYLYPKTTLYYIDNRFLCSSCRHELYYQCHICAKWFLKSNGQICNQCRRKIENTKKVPTACHANNEWTISLSNVR